MERNSRQLLSGRGLWYNAWDTQGYPQTFTRSAWETSCQQANLWGMSVIHPIVAYGTQSWYSVRNIRMLRQIAEFHDLVFAPYIYCCGNTYEAIGQEAIICAQMGTISDRICLKFSQYWEHHPVYATHFGTILRHYFQGEVFPTISANPLSHPKLWIEINTWANALMPQVYFSKWTLLGYQAEQAYIQWEQLAHWIACHGRSLATLLPVISLERHISSYEIATWLQRMQLYSYCGFWHAHVYACYASAVLATPQPVEYDTVHDVPPISGDKSQFGELFELLHERSYNRGDSAYPQLTLSKHLSTS